MGFLVYNYVRVCNYAKSCMWFARRRLASAVLLYPPNYGLWVNLLFFMMCIYKDCFPPMLLVFVMICCTKMPCPLPHNHYCCLLSLPICLPHLLICTCLISSPIACPPSSVLCCGLFRFFCYMLHFFVTLFWLVCVHIFVWLVFVSLNYFDYDILSLVLLNSVSAQNENELLFECILTWCS